MSRLISILLSATLLTPTLAQQTGKTTYEVYAVSYAVIPDFPVAGLVAGADPSRKIDIQMMVWLLKGSNGTNILVDSGFYRDKFFKQWKVRDYVKPSEAISKLGLKPDDITDVITTSIKTQKRETSGALCNIVSGLRLTGSYRAPRVAAALLSKLLSML
ncbi:MAG TPA: hypothetical protein VNS63_17315 [Blastocatellia bacterium]|nr:hypothetical protein [Blastocatellia bacterium]